MTGDYDVYAGTVAIVNRSAIRLKHPEQGFSRWLMLEKDAMHPAAGDDVVCRAHRGTFSVYQLDVLERGRDRVKRERAARQALASKQAEGEDVILRGAASREEPGHAIHEPEAAGVRVWDTSEVRKDVGQEDELQHAPALRARQSQHKPRARKTLPRQDQQTPLEGAQ